MAKKRKTPEERARRLGRDFQPTPVDEQGEPTDASSRPLPRPQAKAAFPLPLEVDGGRRAQQVQNPLSYRSITAR